MIKSMTGYGRSELHSEEKDITVEIKAVNHRYFEFSIRISRIYSFLEDKIKKYVKSRITRGKIDLNITVIHKKAIDGSVTVNHSLAKSYIAAAKEISAAYDLEDDIKTSDIAFMHDVLIIERETADEEKAMSELLPVIEKAVDDFIKMREIEGEKLKEDILSCILNIEKNVEIIESKQEDLIKEYHERLLAKLRETLENSQINEQRIVTEAAIFADRTAVAEETVRLRSHLLQIKDILKLSDSIGKKLDFIVQECNREANTIGSKCQNLEITKIVVNIKSEIEKIREQIQNIE